MRIPVTSLALLLAAALPAAPATAQPQDMYRPGLPPVLGDTQATDTDGAALGQQFRSAYQRHNRPRIAVFWMRRLTDQVTSSWRSVSRVDERLGAGASGSRSATTDHYWGGQSVTGSASQGQLDVNRTRETERGVRLNPDQPQPNAPDGWEWRMENGFAQALVENGATLIDRAVIMRTIGNGAPQGERPDVQGIEAAALLGKADLLMEVLMTDDPASETGVLYRVSVKDVKSGAIVSDVLTPAKLPAGSGRWLATDQGFRMVPQPEAVGRRVAQETMQKLAAAWGG